MVSVFGQACIGHELLPEVAGLELQILRDGVVPGGGHLRRVPVQQTLDAVSGLGCLRQPLEQGRQQLRLVVAHVEQALPDLCRRSTRRGVAAGPVIAQQRQRRIVGRGCLRTRRRRIARPVRRACRPHGEQFGDHVARCHVVLLVGRRSKGRCRDQQRQQHSPAQVRSHTAFSGLDTAAKEQDPLSPYECGASVRRTRMERAPQSRVACGNRVERGSHRRRIRAVVRVRGVDSRAGLAAGRASSWLQLTQAALRADAR